MNTTSFKKMNNLHSNLKSIVPMITNHNKFLIYSKSIMRSIIRQTKQHLICIYNDPAFEKQYSSSTPGMRDTTSTWPSPEVFLCLSAKETEPLWPELCLLVRWAHADVLVRLWAQVAAARATKAARLVNSLRQHRGNVQTTPLRVGQWLSNCGQKCRFA